MRSRALVLLGLGALVTPIAHFITTIAIGRSWAYGKEN